MRYPDLISLISLHQEKYGPVGLIHVDAHDDTEEDMCGELIAHGTPFRRAIEEGCIDSSRVVQIGLRGSGDGPDDWELGRKLVGHSSLHFD